MYYIIHVIIDILGPRQGILTPKFDLYFFGKKIKFSYKA